MKKILLTSFVAFGLYANAQVDVTATAGTSTATYTTLKGAFDAINNGTHQGDIKLSITANTTETATAALNAVTTYSSVLIKPTTTATITGAIASNPILKILGSNVTIDGSSTVNGTSRDLTFSNTSTTSPSVLFMGSSLSASPMTNVTVKNSVLINGSTSTTNLVLANGTTTAGYFNNVTIQNNDVRTGFNGIFVLANTATGNGNNLLITGNTVGNGIVQNGILVSGVGGTSTVSNNTISNSNPTAGTSTTPAASLGINISTGTNNATVSGNTISVKSTAASGTNYTTGIALNVGATNVSTKVFNNNIIEISGFLTYINSNAIYLGGATPNVSIYSNKISGLKNTNTTGTPMQGILLGSTSTAANVLVYNNAISDIQATAGGQVSGIYAYSGAGYKIYNNTVNLNTSNGETGISTGLYVINTITAAGALDIRNNILVNNKTSGTRYAIFSAAANTVFSNINYNNYFSAGTALGNIGSTDRVTLADVQTGFGGNANSLSIAPVFIGTTDLHLNTSTNAGLDNTGVSLAEVTTDLDGNVRSATPDMGAYEFTYVAPVTAPNCTTVSAPLNNATNVLPNPATFNWAVANGANAYKIYLGTTSGGTNVINGTTTTGTSYNVSLSANTTYYLKVVPTNNIGDATGCSEVTFTTGNVVYCAAGATNVGAGLERISNVNFAGINNSSAATGATTGYEDFTAIKASVEQSRSYPISVSIGTADADQVIVWIDYNQDGTFDDSEKNIIGTSSSTVTTVNGNIAIPANAKLGVTRMRVRAHYAASSANATPCGNSGWGQVEDYSVEVKEFLAASDITKAGSISVYPNPFKDVLKISEIKGVKSISVNDMSGRQVRSLAPSAEINLSNLKDGLYIVNLQMEDGSVKSFKAIKK